MDIKSLQAQANQAAAQGQQQLAQYQGQAAQYKGQYDTNSAQAAQANQNLQDYTKQMQGAYDPSTGVGNATSMYNYMLGQANQAQGFDPNSLATATQNLTRTQNALSNVQNASQSSTGGYGLSGSQLGAFYGSLSQPLAQAGQAQSNAVGNLQQLYQNSLTQANQGTSLGLQGEQVTSGNLNQIYQNAQNQTAQALNQMQFYSQLAQQQGGLNAQQQQNYASAVSSLQNAQAAMQQASAAANLANTQARQIQQAIDAAIKAANAPQPSAPTKNAASSKPSGPTNQPQSVSSWLNPGNAWSAFTSSLNNKPSISNTLTGIGELGAAGISGAGKLLGSLWR